MDIPFIFELLEIVGKLLQVQEFVFSSNFEGLKTFPNNCILKRTTRIQAITSSYSYGNISLENTYSSNENHLLAFVVIPHNVSALQNDLKMTSSLRDGKASKGGRFVVVIIWPECLRSLKTETDEIQSIIDGLNDSIKSYTIETELFLVFSTLDSATVAVCEIFLLHDESRNLVLQRKFSVLIPEYNNINFGKAQGIARRRKSLHGISLVAVGVENPEYDADTNFEVTNNSQILFNGGFSVELLHLMQYYYDFRVKALKESTWIDIVNGSLIGMGHRICSGEADLAISITGMLPYSAKFVNFLMPTYSMSISAFFRRSENNQVRDVFTRPFSENLWFGLSSAYILLFASLVLVVHVKIRANKIIVESPNIFETSNFEGATSTNYVCDHDMFLDVALAKESLVWIFGIICQQGWYYCPSSLSVRIIFISSIYFSYFVYAYYSAVLIARFSVETELINSAEQLLESSYEFGIKDEIDLKSWFQGTDANTLGFKVSRRLSATVEERYILEVPDAVNIINKKLYSFVSYPDPFYIYIRTFYSDNIICTLYREMPIVKNKFRTGMFVSKHSPYKEHFNYLLTRIFEQGMTKRNLHYYILNYQTQCDQGSAGAKSLKLNEVFGAFMISVMGFLLSAGVFISEMLIKYLQRDDFDRET